MQSREKERKRRKEKGRAGCCEKKDFLGSPEGEIFFLITWGREHFFIIGWLVALIFFRPHKVLKGGVQRVFEGKECHFFEGSVPGLFQIVECRFEEIGKQFFFFRVRGAVWRDRERESFESVREGCHFFNHRAAIFYINKLLIFFHHQAAIFFNHRAAILLSRGLLISFYHWAASFSSLGCSSIIASTPRLSWCFTTHPSPHQLHTTFSVSPRAVILVS